MVNLFLSDRMLTAKEIRSSFVKHFTDRGHTFVPSAPVVPIGDETLLFTNAGMNQFKDIFLGLKTPPYPRAANSQKCIRVSGKHNDLEEVGQDTYHHTFFEMLGNWSFGNYFKAESIEWAWDLLTKVWKIDENRLWVSVFAGDEKDGLQRDDEAAELWKKLTSVKHDRVLAFGKKDNFWEMGETGPCGPCSEIHIDLGPDRCDKKDEPSHVCGVNKGCARFMELWNLVFIQFNRDDSGKLTQLKAKYVDTGAGLERVTSVLQGKTSNYDTDLFMPVINATAKLCGHRYTSKLGNETDTAFRVIADHTRTLVIAITDGVTPSNDGRGYVMRRLLRRAARYGRTLGLHEPFMYKLVPAVVEIMGEAYPDVKKRADHAATVIEAEEASFGRTVDRGIEIFTSAAEGAGKSKMISGEEAFTLYDTYGFPLDLTELMARERGLLVDSARFAELMEEQRERGRSAKKAGSLIGGLSGVELPKTDDLPKYSTSECQATVQGFVARDGWKTTGKISEADGEAGVVLDKTCFYAESGGQVGDCGEIRAKDGLFSVLRTEKAGECVVHVGKVMQGIIVVGTDVMAHVDKGRESTKKNHTATHLLQWALRQTLGDTVWQQGSLVCGDYLRFDFTWPKAMTPEQAAKVEQLVGEKVSAKLPVTCTVMAIDEAKKLGVMALFNEKYGQEVRVVAVGSPGKDGIKDAFSREFCGGTHVSNTAEIGDFKILREESVSAGVRRITAITGQQLATFLHQRDAVVNQLITLLKVPAEQIVERVEKLLEENKKLAKELKSGGGSADWAAQIDKIFASAKKAGGSSIMAGRLDGATIDQARLAIDSLKKKAGSAVVVLGFEAEGKATLLAGVTDDLVAKGIKAGDIIKEIAPIVGGSGGGRPQLAQAGGKDITKIDEAIAKAVGLIASRLG
jgi:alanyl-tRNA synthetase